MHVYETLIVGTGFTGIGAAIKLTQAGVDDIVIIERDQRVGGTWRDNTYPGAACDIPSLLYSFSFVKNPSWSRAYPTGGEICAHIEDLTDQLAICEDIEADRRFRMIGVLRPTRDPTGAGGVDKTAQRSDP